MPNNKDKKKPQQQESNPLPAMTKDHWDAIARYAESQAQPYLDMASEYWNEVKQYPRQIEEYLTRPRTFDDIMSSPVPPLGLEAPWILHNFVKKPMLEAPIAIKRYQDLTRLKK